MEGHGADAFQPPFSFIFICGGQKKEQLVSHRWIRGRMPAGWKSASTVYQSLYIKTARARCRVQEMTVIMPNVASVSFVGDGYGMQGSGDVASPLESAVRHQPLSHISICKRGEKRKILQTRKPLTATGEHTKCWENRLFCFFLHISTQVVNLKSFWGLSFLPSLLLFHLTSQDSWLFPAFRERLNTFHRS